MPEPTKARMKRVTEESLQRIRQEQLRDSLTVLENAVAGKWGRMYPADFLEAARAAIKKAHP